MPLQPTVTHTRLNNITACLAVAANALKILAGSVETGFLKVIADTTQSLLNCAENIKRNKDDCIQLMEQTHLLLHAIITLHLKSDMGGELPPSTLKHLGKLAETLHKIHTFVEAQQNRSKVKNIFRQSEMNALRKDCKAGLQQGLAVFQICKNTLRRDIAKYLKWLQLYPNRVRIEHPRYVN
ncbi:hypothetical protein B0H19DRAFT_1063240 [Mycena capillaripes]|nr:hypothetical protein B0H19DRAFT_1063240 [Mycena capillaripes]